VRKPILELSNDVTCVCRKKTQRNENDDGSVYSLISERFL
jgi:hypothetical protein